MSSHIAQNSSDHTWNFIGKNKMCHKFMLPGVLILKFANILEILLIGENRNLLNHYGYNMAKKLLSPLTTVDIFDGNFTTINVLYNIFFKKKKCIPVELFFFFQICLAVKKENLRKSSIFIDSVKFLLISFCIAYKSRYMLKMHFPSA
jgi:hypothetical protein